MDLVKSQTVSNNNSITIESFKYSLSELTATRVLLPKLLDWLLQSLASQSDLVSDNYQKIFGLH